MLDQQQYVEVQFIVVRSVNTVCSQANQYTKSIAHAMSILSDHKFDEVYLEARKKRKQRVEKEKQQQEPELAHKTELNFLQLEGVCYCCGKKGHKSPQCKHKNKPKSEWVNNKTKEAAFISQAQSQATNPDDH
jgi:hypothetical protein